MHVTQVLAFLQLTGAASVLGVDALKCNGLTNLCDLRIDQATFPGAHNAGSGFDGALYREIGTPVPSCTWRNQEETFDGQLEFGIRFFDIDTCYLNSEASNCHCGIFGCAYDGSIRKSLLQVDSWMKTHPNEVIFLHFNRDSQEDSRKEIASSIESTLDELWAPNPDNHLAMSTYYKANKQWPTLREAVESGQRIFIFMDSGLSAHVTQDWVVESNDKIISTFNGLNPITVDCGTITENSKLKCDTTADFVEISAFGSFGLCIQAMAVICSKWLGEAQEACYDLRKPLGKTVNFLLVDWTHHYSDEQSVVNKAKFMNQENIKRYLGRDIFFPELQGCSLNPLWWGEYCWKYCPEHGWCWVNQECSEENDSTCVSRDYACYSDC